LDVLIFGLGRKQDKHKLRQAVALAAAQDTGQNGRTRVGIPVVEVLAACKAMLNSIYI